MRFEQLALGKEYARNSCTFASVTLSCGRLFGRDTISGYRYDKVRPSSGFVRRVRFQLRIGPISGEVLYFHDDGQHEMRQSIRDQTSTVYLLQKLQPATSTASDLGISVVPVNTRQT